MSQDWLILLGKEEGPIVNEHMDAYGMLVSYQPIEIHLTYFQRNCTCM